MTCPSLTCSYLIYPDLTCPDWICLDLTCPDLTFPGLISPYLTCPDWTCPGMTYPDLTFPDLNCVVLTIPDLTCPDLARANKLNFSFLGYIEHWFQVLHKVAGWSHLNSNATLWPNLQVRTCKNSSWLPSWTECGNKKKRNPHLDRPEGSALQT